jgi:hypothetical protein
MQILLQGPLLAEHYLIDVMLLWLDSCPGAGSTCASHGRDGAPWSQTPSLLIALLHIGALHSVQCSLLPCGWPSGAGSQEVCCWPLLAPHVNIPDWHLPSTVVPVCGMCPHVTKRQECDHTAGLCLRTPPV